MKYSLLLLLTVLVGSASFAIEIEDHYVAAIDSPDVELNYPLEDSHDPSVGSSGLVDFEDPLNITNDIIYDPISGTYVFISKLGDTLNYRNESSMSLEEYIQYQNQKALEDFWDADVNEQLGIDEGGNSSTPTIDSAIKEERLLFGSDFVEIRPQGSAELSFGVNVSRTDNPVLPERQRRISTFDFDQKIQMNLTGKIGDLMKIGFNYNTEATFDFENELKLNYAGEEDDIIQKIEAGNVSMPLNSSLITGSQSLFGIKSELKFGRMTATTVLSQQRGQRKEIEVAGGAQINDFEIFADNYEENRHFFLGYYFREHYDEANSTLPIVTSQVQIQRMEVWVTNRTNDFDETRNVIGFTDLGEASITDLESSAWHAPLPGIDSILPQDSANSLKQMLLNTPSARNYVNASNVLTQAPFNMTQSVEFEKLENARLLSSNEYTYNSLLGYLSLNQALNNDEVLCVAYQYTYQGKTYQVGEFSTDGIAGQDALYLKLLKSTVRNPQQKLWDLMMKNVYSLGAYQVDQTNFRLDVWYNNPSTGVDINFIPKTNVDDKLLIQLLDLDRLNQQQSSFPDGLFDFIPIQSQNGRISNGGTINPRNGRLYFTTIEPFGQTLDGKLEENGVTAPVRKTVVFQQLYDSTKTAAQQIPELNRYRIKGTYQSAVSSEIALNTMNIPQGSVSVTAGGRQLSEGVDFTVDYNLGRVKILNDGILSSGTPIKISLESNSLFSIQTKSLLGTHLDYRISRDANIGGTIMRLTEKPLTQKVNLGDEPIANTMLGLDGSLRKEVPFLTKMVDKIPFIDTKEKSMVNFSGEIATIIPGHNRAIGKEGNSYIDDFEGSQSAIDIRTFNSWVLASKPAGWDDGNYNNTAHGYGRAKLAWYVIDPLFHVNNNLTPDHINGNNAVQYDHRQRQVQVTEIFKQKQQASGQLTNIPVLDLAYYPTERGPYNFQPNMSEGGGIPYDDENWAGIMRMLTTNDFEASNIEFIQFWVMNPFNNGTTDPGNNEDAVTNTPGKLIFQLGNISEDILKDGRKAFENGLPVDGVYDPANMATTEWGWVPTSQIIVNAFDNDVTTRQYQDVGLDGLSDDEETTFFADEMAALNPAVAASIADDPAGDNYHYFRGDDYDAAELDMLDRYKHYNGLEGNSPTSEMSAVLNADGYPTSASTLPNVEDINQDNNLNETESYFEYSVNLDPNTMDVGTNYIVDRVSTTETNTGKTVDWYQFRIPLREFTGRVNGIQDFRSIRFIRMLMKGWQQEVVLRFARLELIRGEWRTYLGSLLADGEYLQPEESTTTFNVGAVNLEDNSDKKPINYVLPNGIIRETNYQTANLAQMNEQSLVLDVCGLEDGDSRAAYRNVNFDVRNYKKIKMFVHGEANDEILSPLKDNDVTVFVRLGTDFINNYYEYEMPVKVTSWATPAEADSIWKAENEMEIVLATMKAVKKRRNDENISILDRYTLPDENFPDRNITVIGNPNLQNLKTIMIGVRNPKHDDPANQWQPDDGLEKCAEIWVNELRLTDFDESGGWAALGRVSANLADFADVSLAGNYSTPGWGSIEKRVSERAQEYVKGADASATIQLGNFFGKNAGVKIPMYIGYSMNEITPLYDPLNPDLIFHREADETQEEWKERRRNGSDLTIRKSINFTNVGIQKGAAKPKIPTKKKPTGPLSKPDPKKKDPAAGKGDKEKKKKANKPHFYDPSNISVSYSYNEIYHHDVNIAFDRTNNYLAGVNYGFNNSPKPWEPFKKMKVMRKHKFLRPIKDFNLFLAPKQIGFRSSMTRTYNEYAVRYNFSPAPDPIVQYNKLFNWDREYNLKYDITKALKFDIKAMNRAFVDELPGKVDYGAFGYEDATAQQTVTSSLTSFGRTMNYFHDANLSYKLPFSKLPITDWISLTTRVQTNYDWKMAPLAMQQLDRNVGNIIQNSRKVTWNGKLNMITLYNKVPYFKKINQKYSRAGRARANSKSSTKGGKKGAQPKENGKEGKDGKDDPKSTGKKDDGDGFHPLEQATRILLSLKNVSINYSTTDGILLPGYNNGTTIMGLNSSFQSPSVNFIAGGFQDYDIFGRQNDIFFWQEAARMGWLTDSTGYSYVNTQYTSNHQESLNMKASLKPITGMRIDLTATRNLSDNHAALIGWDSEIDDYELQSSMYTGSFSSSIISWRSAFGDGSPTDKLYSAVFESMRDARPEVSAILNSENPNATALNGENGYSGGYDSIQQQVVIGAFITAYAGKPINSKNINPFKQIPLPNWRISYDGLKNTKLLKKHVRTLTFTHAYRSNMNISGYTSNLLYGETNGMASSTDANGNIIALRQIPTVSIMEQFAPLLGVDMTLKNNFMAKLEIKKDRNIALGLANNQILEIRGSEIVFGSGYKFKKLDLGIKFNGQKIPPSDLNLRLDVSIRNNQTITRKIVENQSQATAGQQMISIKFSGDYKLGKSLSLRAFFDRVVNNPFISTSFPTANTNAGVALRFQLQ